MAPIVYIALQDFTFMDIMFKRKYSDYDIGARLFESRRSAHIGEFDLIKDIPPYELQFKLNSKKGIPLKRTKPVADVNDFSSDFLITKKALNALPIKGNAFIKPVISNNKDFCNQEFFHIFPSVFLKDAIDMDKSMIKFWDSGEPRQVLKLILKAGVVLPPMFKLAEFPLGEIYFNKEFVDTYRKSNLTGVAFQDARQLRYFGTSSDITNIPFLEGEMCV